MSDTTSPDTMPKGMFAAARWAAERTPENRNRAVDFYRAVAIMFVVLGHWLLVAAVIRGGEVELAILLAEQPWTQYATWLFQVMPVFFFVGGFSNSLSWSSARKDPEKARIWASTRLARLLKPTVPLVLVWAVLAFIAGKMGVSPDLIGAASQAALVPIWFLAVYIVITVAVPVTMAIWDRIGFLSVILLALGAIAVDTIAFSFDQQWLRWSNYGFVWLAVHQLGYWWRGNDRPTIYALALIALGVAWLYVLIAQLGFPVGMVSVPGEEISNTRPPTTAMLAIGCVQIGTILLVSGPVSAWLRNTRPWAWVILLNQMIMSVYLWHITAMIGIIGFAVLLGGIGLEMAPGSGLWWALRPGLGRALCPVPDPARAHLPALRIRQPRRARGAARPVAIHRRGAGDLRGPGDDGLERDRRGQCDWRQLDRGPAGAGRCRAGDQARLVTGGGLP